MKFLNNLESEKALQQQNLLRSAAYTFQIVCIMYVRMVYNALQMIITSEVVLVIPLYPIVLKQK